MEVCVNEIATDVGSTLELLQPEQCISQWMYELEILRIYTRPSVCR